MSFESLVLVAFLIVIPLIERLVRAMRERSRPRPVDKADVPVPPRPALPRPPVPEEAERLTSRERAPVHRVVPTAQVAPEPVRHVPALRRSRRIVSADLRHSIVMMTILGPCKALDDDRGRR